MNQNQQNDRFQEVGSNASNNQRWEINKQPLVPGAPFPFLDGYFKDIRQLQGQKGAFQVHVVTTVNPDGSLGQDVDISGGKTLDDKLNDIPLGTFIRIQYEGKTVSKSTGNSYNTWKVFKDEGAIPYAQLGGFARQQHAPAPVQQFQQQAPAPAFNPNAGFQNNAGVNSFQHTGSQQTNQPVFGGGSVAGGFNPNAVPQQAPAFNPAQTFAQPAAVPQQPFVAAPQAAPVQQQQFQQQAPPANTGGVVFGGQAQQGNPFAVDPNQPLPF